MRSIVLWADTAPPEVSVEVISDKTAELTLWNCWRDEHGVTQAWIGEGGMVIYELTPSHLRFECNSVSSRTFTDLIFEVFFPVDDE